MVDLGLGAEEYKERFANQSRETLYVTLRTSATHDVREIARYRAAQIVKTSPRLETAVRGATTHLLRVKNKERRDGVTGAMSRVASRISEFLWSKTEILFFESEKMQPSQKWMRRELQPLSLDHLASAVAERFDNESFLEYLVGSAAHLREKDAEGFGLFDSAGSLLGCVWVASSRDSSCRSSTRGWTPRPRTASYSSISGASPPMLRTSTVKRFWPSVRNTCEHERRAWSYSAASNDDSVRRLKNAGFQPRYSLFCRRMFGWRTTSGKTSQANQPHTLRRSHLASKRRGRFA